MRPIEGRAVAIGIVFAPEGRSGRRLLRNVSELPCPPPYPWVRPVAEHLGAVLLRRRIEGYKYPGDLVYPEYNYSRRADDFGRRPFLGPLRDPAEDFADDSTESIGGLLVVGERSEGKEIGIDLVVLYQGDHL